MSVLNKIMGAVLLLLASPALSEPLSVLIQEKVLEKYEYQIDETSKIEVKFSGGNSDVNAIQINDFFFDKSSGQFIADTSLDSGEIKRIGGIIFITIPVIVPTRKLVPGEIVTKENLAIVHMPKGRVSSFSIVSFEEVVGMEVKRLLTPGRPIATQSLTHPLIIKRGDKIEILLKMGALVVRAPGKATSDASLGQKLRVVNLVSNKNVVGLAKSEKVVEVIQ